MLTVLKIFNNIRRVVALGMLAINPLYSQPKCAQFVYSLQTFKTNKKILKLMLNYGMII